MNTLYKLTVVVLLLKINSELNYIADTLDKRL